MSVGDGSATLRLLGGSINRFPLHEHPIRSHPFTLEGSCLSSIIPRLGDPTFLVTHGGMIVVEVRNLALDEASRLDDAIATDCSIGHDIVRHAARHCLSPDTHNERTDMLSWGIRDKRRAADCRGQIGPEDAATYMSVFQTSWGDEEGCAFAGSVSQAMRVMVRDGFAPGGRFLFLFQSSTTPPLDINSIFHDGTVPVQLVDVFESHGFVPDSCGKCSTFQLKRGHESAFVLICWDRDHYLHSRRVFGSLVRGTSARHYGQLQSTALLEAAVWPYGDGCVTKNQLLKYVRRHDVLIAPDDDHAMDLKGLGLMHCQATAELFALESVLHQHGHHGRSIMWLVHKFVHKAFRPVACTLVDACQRGNGVACVELFQSSHLTKVCYLPTAVPIAAHIAHLKATMGGRTAGPQCRTLYHGTSASNADSMVANFIDLDQCSAYCDFGRAFYTTPDVQYAIDAARATAGDGTKALIAMRSEKPFPQGAEHRLRADEWCDLVAACRRSDGAAKKTLNSLVTDAGVLTGWITENASEVDAGRRAIPTNREQTAFLEKGLHLLSECTWTIYLFD